ncbi:MAG: peptidylprolyl isomerase [Bacteroidales bacterium]|jgi:peptidylprolyl isomerase
MNKILLVALLFSIVSCGATEPPAKETYVLLTTTLGDIKLKLYDETPVHRDNFVKLVNAQVYDDVIFHRVISSFMIQTGDPKTKTEGLPIGADTLSTYTIPPEFNSLFYHKKGALAAARQGNNVNPEMRSSGTQFYIVQGSHWNDNRLNQMETTINTNIKQSMFNKYMFEVMDSSSNAETPLSSSEIQEIASNKMFNYLAENGDYKMSKKQREDYINIGGSPSLDGTYTVFGEVVEGLDVVDKIAAVATDGNDKPLSEIRIIKAKIVKK